MIKSRYSSYRKFHSLLSVREYDLKKNVKSYLEISTLKADGIVVAVGRRVDGFRLRDETRALDAQKLTIPGAPLLGGDHGGGGTQRGRRDPAVLPGQRGAGQQHWLLESGGIDGLRRGGRQCSKCQEAGQQYFQMGFHMDFHLLWVAVISRRFR